MLGPHVSWNMWTKKGDHTVKIFIEFVKEFSYKKAKTLRRTALVADVIYAILRNVSARIRQR